MASTMPLEDSAPGLGRTVCIVFQHGGANSLTSIRLRPDVSLNDMTNILLSEYHGVPDTVPHRTTRPVTEATSREEPVDLESRARHQATITRPAPMHPLGPPPLRSNNSSFASEAASSGEGRQLAVQGDSDSKKALPVHSKVAKTRVALLIVGALSLVVVPGLVLGVVTSQITWGIELSGAIATVVGLFAGLYYYHNK